MAAVRIKRVYEPPSSKDGRRVLVDRLWPRGLAKSSAGIDSWAKDAAPSTELRTWFHKDREQWTEFRRRYLEELGANPGATADLVERLRGGETLTLLYASRDEERNHAMVLAEHLRSRARPARLKKGTKKPASKKRGTSGENAARRKKP